MKLFSAVAVICLGAFCISAAPSQSASVPPEFNAAQEIANTRVTLLQISRVAAFTRQFNENETEFRAFTPGVEVVYLVEQIGDAPKAMAHHGSSRLFINGKHLQSADGIVAGGAGRIEAYSRTTSINGFELPHASNSAKLVRDFIRGVTTSDSMVDLHFEFGFGELRDFEFRNVPL